MSLKNVNCAVCGREFTPITANGKYCSRKCSEIGKSTRRREWENRNGYLEKKRKQAQARRDAIKAKVEAERAESARLAEESREKRIAEIEIDPAGDLAGMFIASRTSGNTSPEYWEAFKMYDLKHAEDSGRTSMTTVNGISVHEDMFGPLVSESIAAGSYIVVRTDYERKTKCLEDGNQAEPAEEAQTDHD